MIVYKIRRKADGMFSTGGSSPSFTKNGKIWKQKGHLTNHLNQLDNDSKFIYLTVCEIIPYELVEQPAGPAVDIGVYLMDLANKKKIRKDNAYAAKQAYHKEQRRLEFEKLKQEFGDD